MEYKNVSEIKPKDIINDPEDNTIYVVINIIPGNNPRLVLRNFVTQKITQRSVPRNKQFLLIEPEIVQFQVNYYNGSMLNIMNPETFEESEIDGTSLGERFESLKRAIDSGRNVYIELERIDTIQNIKDFLIREEKIISKEPTLQEQPPPNRRSGETENKQKPARVSAKHETSSSEPSPPPKVVVSSSQNEQSSSNKLKTDVKASDKSKKEATSQKASPVPSNKQEILSPSPPKKESIPPSPVNTPSGTPIELKQFKGLDDKIFEVLRTEYHINTLEDLINANVADLAKIPKTNEKKIKEWQKKANELLKKLAKK